MAITFPKEIKVGSIVRITLILDPTIGMVKEVITDKSKYPSNHDFWDHWTSGCWGWQKKPLYVVNLGGKMKICSEQLWKYVNSGHDYSKCPVSDQVLLPKAAVKLY